MAHANVTKHIDAAPETVWKVLSNPQRFEEWLTLHTKWSSEPPAELTQGSQIKEVVTIMGMANTIEWTVEEFDAPHSHEDHRYRDGRRRGDLHPDGRGRR